jgi:hypothetical protein
MDLGRALSLPWVGRFRCDKRLYLRCTRGRRRIVAVAMQVLALVVSIVAAIVAVVVRRREQQEWQEWQDKELFSPKDLRQGRRRPARQHG